MTAAVLSFPNAASDSAEQAFMVKAGGASWGLPAQSVQTVFRVAGLTPVPLAPPVIEGLVNLRGRVVLAINLAWRLFGTPAAPIDRSRAPLAVAVELGQDVFALLVDDVGDVVGIDANQRVAPPAHVSNDLARMTATWFRTRDGLVPLLDLARLLDIEADRRSGLERRAHTPVTIGAKP